MDEIWIDPNAIRFKIAPIHDLQGYIGGEWDIERRWDLALATKHRSIAARYRDGQRWEDTALFTDLYARRFERGESVRGCRTMQALLEQYYNRVDGLFEALRTQGFDKSAGPLPGFLQGRDQTFIGNQGNHRLAMAQVLGLKAIAGKIVCRHPLA